MAFQSLKEASDVLLNPLNPNGLLANGEDRIAVCQFGARDLHKHLWKLPIPEFDPVKGLHAAIAEAGAKVASRTKVKLEELRQRRGDGFTVTIARRELRTLLRTSVEGRAVENSVVKLLAGRGHADKLVVSSGQR